MKEFIEKLNGKLEEEIKKINDEPWLDCEERIKKQCIYCKTIKIVNELAEEYKQCALCYLQSPCEYQNKNAEMPMEYWEKGWIPCENELPNTSEWHPSVVAKEFLVTYYPDEVTKPWVGIRYFKKDTNDFLTKKEEKVIAWQPLPAPYNPKGE